jgi:hypothetical protein
VTSVVSGGLARDIALVALALPFHVAHEASGAVLDLLLGPEEDPWTYVPTDAGGEIAFDPEALSSTISWKAMSGGHP